MDENGSQGARDVDMTADREMLEGQVGTLPGVVTTTVTRGLPGPFQRETLDREMSEIKDEVLRMGSLVAAQIGLVGGEIADAPQHVVQLVDAARPPPIGEALQLELEVGEHAWVEQLAQLLRPEQVAEQVAVERQGGSTPFGERRIAVVHVGGDPVEQQARRER